MEATFSEKIKARTKGIGLEVIKLIDELPPKQAAWIISKQILRSATAIWIKLPRCVPCEIIT